MDNKKTNEKFSPQGPNCAQTEIELLNAELAGTAWNVLNSHNVKRDSKRGTRLKFKSLVK